MTTKELLELHAQAKKALEAVEEEMYKHLDSNTSLSPQEIQEVLEVLGYV